jgi:hypothetical protein
VCDGKDAEKEREGKSVDEKRGAWAQAARQSSGGPEVASDFLFSSRTSTKKSFV